MFDKKYYENIWSTVHRHDYCESRANFLITKYSRTRILDVGTGCGFLVKILREKGCDAWGLEISDYAIENTCAKGYVLKADIRDIPFKDNFFDVIHSNGLWEYIPEQDISKAWKECQRVGKYQEHNYDTSDTTPDIPEHHYITYRSSEWWKNQFNI